jgi:hypothetical protein
MTTADRIVKLKELPQNNKCCDCTANETAWASTNIGCFFCINCSGAHRSLGTHISKVKSVTLDDWEPKEVDNMEVWGNDKVNELYEKEVPSYYPKPNESSSSDYRKEYIYAKYSHKYFTKAQDVPRPVHANENKDSELHRLNSLKTKKHKTIKNSQHDSQPRGHVEFEGILQIKLKRGIDMIPCDITRKSDPYVYFASGPSNDDPSDLYPGQIVKSEVREQTLNPVWDQNLMVCVADVTKDTLHVEVWDWDRVSDDDFMGEYHLSLKDYDLRSGKVFPISIKLQRVNKGLLEFDISFQNLKK